eukprot:TRINITY_DN2646_c3_g1_i1.p1 TRINITY_DN2646_c3_g1~~TRINITY_DN2646_c3_g1_i1.p1  ORF type:complete len:525 (+),score=73.87 TRINITY_DN2646_c3_g1_i1:66-1577(+)
MSISSSMTGTPGSFWGAYVLAINVIFGSGVLAMPHALQTAGFALGLVMLGVISTIAWITCMWTIETISRLSFLETLWKSGELKVNEDKETGDDAALVGFHSELVSGLYENASVEHSSSTPCATTDQITRDWEVNELCHAFLGKNWALAYDSCLTVYTWAVMWLYVSVWCSAFTMIVPISGLTTFQGCHTPFHGDCLKSYRIFVGVFVVVMSLLCLREWKAFSKIQGFFTVFANICLIIMVSSVVVGLFAGSYIKDGEHASTHKSAPYLAGGNKAADFGEFGALFGTCIFSQMAHQGTSKILSMIDKKKNVGKLFAAAFVTTSTFYVILSLAAALYFGGLTNSIVTLNWQDYSPYSDGRKDTFTKILSAVIITFPVGTTSAAYMFFVKTIGVQIEFWMKQRYSWNNLSAICRVIAFFPPIVGGVISSDVKTIVSVCGLFGFFVMVFFPSMLQYYSTRKLTSLGRDPATPFSWVFSSTEAVYVMTAVGGFGFVFYVYNTISSIVS